MDPPKFCCVISNKSAQISQNFRAVTACGQRHHKFELLFPQLFERGAEDYVDRGRRGVAGRARSGVQAPGHSLQPIVSVIPALNDATSGGTASGSMDPPRETKRASFSKVGLFRSCAPDRPNLEKRRVKAGPTQISKQISRNLGLGQPWRLTRASWAWHSFMLSAKFEREVEYASCNLCNAEISFRPRF